MLQGQLFHKEWQNWLKLCDVISEPPPNPLQVCFGMVRLLSQQCFNFPELCCHRNKIKVI